MIYAVFVVVVLVAAYVIFLVGFYAGRDEQRRAMTLPEETARRYRDTEVRWRA